MKADMTRRMLDLIQILRILLHNRRPANAGTNFSRTTEAGGSYTRTRIEFEK
jgi:hypothetical protein